MRFILSEEYRKNFFKFPWSTLIYIQQRHDKKWNWIMVYSNEQLEH